jgi:hypothetical protein
MNQEVKINQNYVQLMKSVVECSQGCLIDEARSEWYIKSYYKEEDGVTCLCGHEHCKHVYVIKNYKNHNLLQPIGSNCMKYFLWDEENKNILKAYETWHVKKYNNTGLQYDGVEFCEVIKDVEYVQMIQRCCSTKEHERLINYAKAVWRFNPPQPTKLKQVCQKCVEQQKKGYKKCYGCFAEQKAKPACETCVEQKKKGYTSCFPCYKKDYMIKFNKTV